MASNPPPSGGPPPPGAGGNPPKKDEGAPKPPFPAGATAAFLKPAVPLQAPTQKSAMPSSSMASAAATTANAANMNMGPKPSFQPTPKPISTMEPKPPSAFGGIPSAIPTPKPIGLSAFAATNNNGASAASKAPTIPPPSNRPTVAAPVPSVTKKVNPVAKSAAAASMAKKPSTASAAGPGPIDGQTFVVGKTLPTQKAKNDTFKTIMPPHPPAGGAGGKKSSPVLPTAASKGTQDVEMKDVSAKKIAPKPKQNPGAASMASAMKKAAASAAKAPSKKMDSKKDGKKSDGSSSKKAPNKQKQAPVKFLNLGMKPPPGSKPTFGPFGVMPPPASAAASANTPPGSNGGNAANNAPSATAHMASAHMAKMGAVPQQSQFNLSQNNPGNSEKKAKLDGLTPTTGGAKKPPPSAKAASSGSSGGSKKKSKSNNGKPSKSSASSGSASAGATASVASGMALMSGAASIPAPAAADNIVIVQNNMHPTGRELKVEDALLYLDQVKLEFGDRPRIYNEFLEIMKNFKAQEVDTIGVINRVRRLFHGYNNLILGFNTFLPEGYKIEMRDLEPVFVGPGLPGTTHTPGFKPPPGPGGPPGGRGMPGRGGPGGRGMGPPGAFGRVGRGMGPLGRGPMPGRGPPPGGRGMGPVGRGGPISRVSQEYVFGRMGGRGGPMAGRGGPAPAPGGPGMKPTPQQQQQMMQAQNAKAKQSQQQAQSQEAQNSQQQQQQQQGAAATRTIEFDHAIMYVTNIKKRFANQPRIYHTFLEILHTYQKEQRGIKEVLEQVSSLFADHPDLLREFTFFLPDAVQEQAKERLSRAAAEAEAKQRAAAVEAAAKQQQAQAQQAQQQAAAAESGKKGAPTGWRSTTASGVTPKGGKMGQRVGVEPLMPSGTQKFIDMTQPDEAGVESPVRRQPSAPASTVTQAPPPQESFTYNAGVERQFFDLVKAALTSFSRDGQAYAEFIKTLDMYAQEILSRNDMLGYVERLLGKHKDLFEEFKRIINAVGSPEAPAHDDSWHSVPLSEIDFSRCRRCSPSYRALPRDYPNPPCSERSEIDRKVLNDVWVSLPLGSEENNTFRHMRKNQYEETLFRCEDMRFEIDMCIDSNAATLQRLTKIYDEIQFLSENELVLTKGSMVKKSLYPDGAGLGGKIFQYTLDGRVLGVIHKHSIKRIYGDDGNEMLDLCFKNPAVALPIVVNRLRQKDEEWRAASEVLNRKWKDLAEHNYYKSLDHRSITWRTTDKRATSTRTIVAEIKDRAAHNGFEGEAAANARMEKAKEEHGMFYEITKGCDIPRKMDLTCLPKPTKTIFTPHLSFMYDSNSWAQQDAYRIISFALERGSISPGDKERSSRLWRDFIGPWFGLSLAWMQNPAALFTASPEALEDFDEDEDSTSTDNAEKESGNDEEDAMSRSSSGGDDNVNNDVNAAGTDGHFVKEEIMKPKTSVIAGDAMADTGYFSSTNHVPFPPETLVSTTFGEGKVIQYLREDGVYEVSYPMTDKEEDDDDAASSTAYLRPDAVYGSLFPVKPSLLTDQLRTNDQEVPKRSDDQMIIGTQCLYLFFRLHQVLIRRLNIAKKLAVDVSNDTALGRHIEKLTYEGDPDEGKKRYDAFLGLVYALIDAGTGSSEPSEGGKYEDRVRHLLGNNAHELTTMDKLISHVLKHLQNMANDDTLQNMIEIYRRHELAGNFKPSAFREEAALMSEGENMFAFQICNMPKTDQKISHCEFLGCIAEDVEDEDEMAPENEDHKRGIDVAMDDADDSGHAAKRSKRAV